MKILIFVVMILVLTGSVSAYYCLRPTEPISMTEFKLDVNTLIVNYELKQGYSEEGIVNKIKSFHPCSQWP